MSRIIPVILVALLCVPYSSGHTCDPFDCPVLFRFYSWTLRLPRTLVLVLMALHVPCTLPTALAALSVRSALFLRDFTILTCAQGQRHRWMVK